MAAKQSLKPEDLSFPPTILSDSDNTSNFTCGNKDIDYFIQKVSFKINGSALLIFLSTIQI